MSPSVLGNVEYFFSVSVLGYAMATSELDVVFNLNEAHFHATFMPALLYGVI